MRLLLRSDEKIYKSAYDPGHMKESRVLSIATYNILFGGQPCNCYSGESMPELGFEANQHRLTKILAEIQRINPDFIAIQEANGIEDHPDKLGPFVNEEGYVHRSLSAGRTNHGNYGTFDVATLARLPFAAYLPVHFRGEFRNAALMTPLSLDSNALNELGIPYDQEILRIAICNAHLSPDAEDHEHAEDRRLEEITLLLDSMQYTPYRIIVGDLNSLSRHDNYLPSDLNPAQTAKFVGSDGQIRYDVSDALVDAGYLDMAVELGRRNQNLNTVPTKICSDDDHGDPKKGLRIDQIHMSRPLVELIRSSGAQMTIRVVRNKITEHASDHYPVVLRVRFPTSSQ